MKMMGIGAGPIMVSWLITYGVIFAIVAALITFVASFNLFSRSVGSLLAAIPIFRQQRLTCSPARQAPSLVFLFFMLFGLDIVAFAFMISVLFDRAKVASTAGVSLFFAAYFAFFAVNSPNASASSKR
jgi:hypothetical protein